MHYQEIHFATIDSTNKYLKENYASLDDLVIVSSDYQSKGKGRNDRIWKSDNGDNLLFSLLIKERDLVNLGGYLSLPAAYTVAKYLEEELNIKDVYIKWPNDIYIKDKKVCGILLEGQLPNYLIIGIGINLNQKDFIGDYHVSPTSLFLETGKKIEINDFKKGLFSSLISSIINVDELKEDFLSYYQSHDYLKDKEVSFYIDNEYKNGKVVGIDDKFALIIEKDGKRSALQSGEITIKKEN